MVIFSGLKHKIALQIHPISFNHLFLCFTSFVKCEPDLNNVILFKKTVRDAFDKYITSSHLKILIPLFVVVKKRTIWGTICRLPCVDTCHQYNSN